MLSLGDPLLQATFDRCRECGDGRRECVAYWCADLIDPNLLTRVVHPVHTARGGGYEVDDDWVMQFFVSLHRNHEVVRVQVHTHPRAAGHSWIDDAYSLVPAQGFLSLVIPNFAQGPVSLDHTHLVEMTAEGEWSERLAEQVFVRV